MAYVKPLPREQLAEFEPAFKMVEAAMGFVPNSMLTMAHRPDILRGFMGLAAAVLGPGAIEPGLKQLIARSPATSPDAAIARRTLPRARSTWESRRRSSTRPSSSRPARSSARTNGRR